MMNKTFSPFNVNFKSDSPGHTMLPSRSGTGKTVLYTMIAPHVDEQPSSIMEKLNDGEREALYAWAKAQPAGENGAIDLMNWPGWSEAFLRKYGQQI